MKINLKPGVSIMFFLSLLEVNYYTGLFSYFIKLLNFNFSSFFNKISVFVLILIISILFYFFLLLSDRKDQNKNTEKDNLEWLNDFNAAMALIFYVAGFLLLRGYGLYGLKHLEISLADYWDFIYYGLIWFLPSILIVIRPSLFFSGAYYKIYRICAVTFISFFLLAVGYNAAKAISCDFNRESDCVASKALKEKDYTLCGKLKDAMDSQINACYLVMSEKLDDISFCEKVEYDYRCVRNIAINKKERGLCELSDGGIPLFKGMCYSDYDKAVSP